MRYKAIMMSVVTLSHAIIPINLSHKPSSMTATFTYTIFLGIVYLTINIGRSLDPQQKHKH